jgi:hypothetical protein
MTTSKGLGISIKYGDHWSSASTSMLSVSACRRAITRAWHCCASYRVTSGFVLADYLPQPRTPTDGRNRQFASLRESDAPIEFHKARVGAEAIHASVGRQIGRQVVGPVFVGMIEQGECLVSCSCLDDLEFLRLLERKRRCRLASSVTRETESRDLFLAIVPASKFGK